MTAREDNALDLRARRAAKRAGFVASRSRDRTEHLNNKGGYMLVEPYQNCVVAGVDYDLSAEEVIDFCAEQNAPTGQAQVK